MVAHELVGLNVVSELATRTHASRGKTWVRYAMAARHSGSIDGSVKAGPQMWSSRTMAAGSLQPFLWVIKCLSSCIRRNLFPGLVKNFRGLSFMHGLHGVHGS